MLEGAFTYQRRESPDSKGIRTEIKTIVNSYKEYKRRTLIGCRRGAIRSENTMHGLNCVKVHRDLRQGVQESHRFEQ